MDATTEDRKYPQWFEDFLNAKTEALPGFLGDWADVGVHLEETENSITCYSIEDFTKVHEQPDAVFFGDQRTRRRRLVMWLWDAIVYQQLADAYKKHPELIGDFAWAEMPMRLMFSEQYGDEIFGKEWE